MKNIFRQGKVNFFIFKNTFIMIGITQHYHDKLFSYGTIIKVWIFKFIHFTLNLRYYRSVILKSMLDLKYTRTYRNAET